MELFEQAAYVAPQVIDTFDALEVLGAAEGVQACGGGSVVCVVSLA